MTVQGKEITDLGFEILDTYEEDINPSSTMSTSMDSTLPENILESTDYESYINSEDKLLPNLSYCEDEFHHHFKHFFHDISLYGDIETINL